MRVRRVTALVRTAASAGDGSVLANGRLRLGAMPASSTKWPKRPSKREAGPSVGGTSRPLPGAVRTACPGHQPRSRTPPVKESGAGRCRQAAAARDGKGSPAGPRVRDDAGPD
jgi:hypothetical protein